jgi:hypothetical protein
VLGVGRNLTPEVRWLLELERRHREHIATVRQFFAALGEVWWLTLEATSLRHQRDAALQEVAAARPAPTSAHRETQMSTDRTATAKARVVGQTDDMPTLRVNLEEHIRTLARAEVEHDAERARLMAAMRTLQASEGRASELAQEALRRHEIVASELSAVRTRLHDATEQLRRSDTVTADLEKQVSGLRAGLQARTAELAVLRASTSWRAAAPLRWAAWTARRAVTGSGKAPIGLLDAIRLWVRPRSARRAYIVGSSRWFDADFYALRAAGCPSRPLAALRHYVRHGELEGRAPHLLFDPAFYSSRNQDVPIAGISPLTHFVLLGQYSGRAPHPLFDAARYLRLNPDVALSGLAPLAHYLDHGWREGRSPHALFDPAFYLSSNPDVRTAGKEPLSHYLESGWLELRSPHPLFDSAFYLATNPDVLRAGMEPLTHYILHGAGERRRPHPLFDAKYYVTAYDDIDPARVNPLAHFVDDGWREGRTPNMLFDIAWYLQRYPAARTTNPLIHFARTGRRRGYWTNQWGVPIPHMDLPDYLRRDRRWMSPPAPRVLV